jgi:hypothetical protein
MFPNILLSRIKVVEEVTTLEGKVMKNFVLISIILTIFLGSGRVFADTETPGNYVQDHDTYSMQLNGFSKELIDPTEVQIDRHEGRYPPPAPNQRQQAMLNLINNEPAEPLKPFGQDTVDAPKDVSQISPFWRKIFGLDDNSL